MATKQKNNSLDSEHIQDQNQKCSSQTEATLSEKFSCTFSTFVAIGCDIDVDAMAKNYKAGDLNNQEPLFTGRGKRFIRYLYFRQINEKLNGSDRAFLDQKTPLSQIKYHIPTLINAILTSNSNVFRIFSDLLFAKYKWFTLLLAISLIPASTNIQQLLFPEQIAQGKWWFCILIAIILSIFYVATNLFGFSHDQNIKELLHAQSDIETYPEAKFHVKEYLVNNYKLIEKYKPNNETESANEAKSSSINPFSRLGKYIQNRFLKLGLWLNREDVILWIEQATETSIIDLIEEGQTREKEKEESEKKNLSEKEKLREQIKELTEYYEEKLKGLQSVITKSSQEFQKIKEEKQNLQRIKGMTLDDLELCPTLVNAEAFPGVTIGLVVKTLRKKNQYITRASIALFLTALTTSLKDRPIKYEDFSCHTCKEFYSSELRSTWIALYEDDRDSILEYEDKFADASFSMNTLCSSLYADNPRSGSKSKKEEAAVMNCSFSDWVKYRSPKSS